jgi:hypothetical protein
MGYIKANIEKDGKGGGKSGENIVKRMTNGSDGGSSMISNNEKSMNTSMQEL